jgi:predicted dehydrogenase
MSAVEPLRIAVIGFGKLGLLHAALANAVPGARLAAVVDSTPMMLDALKAYMPDVRTYNDYRVLLRDGGIDAALIATPTQLHVPIAVDCVSAGVRIFFQTPGAARCAPAGRLRAARRPRPVVNMVGYMGRYIDTFAKAKEIIASGALGKLQIFRSSMYIGQLFKPGKGWRYDKNVSGGGVLITQNTHVIDKLLWMFGEVEDVNGRTGALYSTGVEDYCHAVLRFRSGLLGYLDASWSARHYRTPTISMHVQGIAGTLDVDDDHVRLFLDKSFAPFSEGWSSWRKPDLYRGVSVDIGGPQYTIQMEKFVAAIRSGAAIECNVASAVSVQAVVDAIYRSADTNGMTVKPVTVHP